MKCINSSRNNHFHEIVCKGVLVADKVPHLKRSWYRSWTLTL